VIKTNAYQLVDEFINAEKYEWMIYIYNGITLTAAGLCLLIALILAEPPKNAKVLPVMIAAMICLILSLHFFSEGYNIKGAKEAQSGAFADIRANDRY
jgi:uncharacterized membrane protein